VTCFAFAWPHSPRVSQFWQLYCAFSGHLRDEEEKFGKMGTNYLALNLTISWVTSIVALQPNFQLVARLYFWSVSVTSQLLLLCLGISHSPLAHTGISDLLGTIKEVA
jgi:hypothetical protein